MPHEVDVHVGQRLRQRRLTIGATQTQIAGQLGIRFQQLHKYETAANRISASRLWKIAQVLGVPPSYFFDGLSDENGDTVVAEDDPRGDDNVISLLHVYCSIPQAQRQRLFKLARRLGEAPVAPSGQPSDQPEAIPAEPARAARQA